MQDSIKEYVHKVINHMEAYVQRNVHTNGIENFWSLLKRTIRGTDVSVEPFHLFVMLMSRASGLTIAKMIMQDD